MLAKEVMSKYVLTCGMDTTVHDLIRLFVANKVSAIPVVGDDSELKGIISEADLLYKRVYPHVPRYFNVLGASLYYSGYGKYVETFQKLLATEAKDIMTKEVKTVSPETDCDIIANMMIDEHLKNIPVVKDGRLVGIVDRSDILHMIAKERNLS